MTRLAAQVVAAQQAVRAMQQQKMQAAAAAAGYPQHQLQDLNDSNVLVQNIVSNIDRTLQRINEMHGLYLEKKRLTVRYAGALPPEVESRKRFLDKQIQQGYSQLSKSIQFANDSIGLFNHSPAAQVPRLLHIVSLKRHQLNTHLEALKSSQNKSISGAAPPTNSSQGGSSRQHSHVTGGPSSSDEISSSSHTKSTNPTPHQVAPPRQDTHSHLRERLIARVTGSNEERQMRETAKELLVKKTKAPADSSTNLSTAKKS